MTDQPALDLDAIAARAAHLHEYALLDDKPLQQEADQLTGTDVPALIAALAHAERIRENADFHLGQEMARRQLAEKAVLEAQQERDKLIRWHREDEMTREVLLAEIRHLRAWITKLETYAHGCDAEGCVIPHSQAKVPNDWGGRRVIAKCQELGIKTGKTKIEEAIRIRKNWPLSDVPPHVPYSSVTDMSPDENPQEDIFAGQTSPGDPQGTPQDTPQRGTSPRPPPRRGDVPGAHPSAPSATPPSTAHGQPAATTPTSAATP